MTQFTALVDDGHDVIAEAELILLDALFDETIGDGLSGVACESIERHRPNDIHGRAADGTLRSLIVPKRIREWRRAPP